MICIRVLSPCGAVQLNVHGLITHALVLAKLLQAVSAAPQQIMQLNFLAATGASDPVLSVQACTACKKPDTVKRLQS